MYRKSPNQTGPGELCEQPFYQHAPLLVALQLSLGRNPFKGVIQVSGESSSLAFQTKGTK